MSTGVLAGELEVINPEVPFPEGPLWRDGQLHYVDYGADTLTNLTFGEMEDTVFVTAASDAWNEPYPGQVYKLENR